MYDILEKEIPWKQEQSVVFGKSHNQPRLTCFLGDDGKSYTYSGYKRIPEKFTPTLIEITKKLQQIVNEINPDHSLYTSVLGNYYRTGVDNIGKHSDDEKDLIPDSFISSLSLGTERFFDIYDKENDKKVLRLTLENGSLLLMGKNIQKLYKHAVPKQLKIKEGRINLTWRVVKEEK